MQRLVEIGSIRQPPSTSAERQVMGYAQHDRRRSFFPTLLLGLGLLTLNDGASAQARGRVGPGDRWIAIDETYLGRFPAAVRAGIVAQGKLCGAHAAVRATFAKYIHVGSGGRDFITLHFDHFRCADRERICGPQGCLHQVYAPVGDSYLLIFNARVRDVELAMVNGRVAVRVECPAAAASHCPHVLQWNGHQLAEVP
jgi:hypothetical protein